MTLEDNSLCSNRGNSRAELPADLVCDLVSCRSEYAELESRFASHTAKYNQAQYGLAGRIVKLAVGLRTDTGAWASFVAAPEWEGRTRPKPSDRLKALRHAVRFALPAGTSRQIQSYWSRALEVLVGEGFDAATVPEALAKGGGFQAICRANKRGERRDPAPGSVHRARLFPRPRPTVPSILRDAVVCSEKGEHWIEDAHGRKLLMLALPKSYRRRLLPGELLIEAVATEAEPSTLDMTRIRLWHHASVFQLRRKAMTLLTGVAPEGETTGEGEVSKTDAAE